MANQLDELDGPIMEEGRDVNVIAKKVPAKVGVGSTIFEVLLWILGIIPGVIFTFMKINAKKYFQQLEQKIQHDASQIDNYLENRVVILSNAAKLVEKAIDLDKSTYADIAALRSGGQVVKQGDDEARNAVSTQLDNASRQFNMVMERYPELQSHQEIQDALQQNSYLQREITAARELYNDTVNQWNAQIFAWPTKAIVAAREGYTTRIPFIASKEIKDRARDVFF